MCIRDSNKCLATPFQQSCNANRQQKGNSRNDRYWRTKSLTVFKFCFFILAFLLLVLSHLRLWTFDINVQCHKPWNTSNSLVIFQSCYKIDYPIFIRFSTNIHQSTKLRVEQSTETLKKPKVGRKLFSIKVFETSKDLQWRLVYINSLHWVPLFKFSWRFPPVSYTHLTLPTICSV